MKIKLFWPLLDLKEGRASIAETEKKILALLAENEVVVSDARSEHVDLSHVGERNASGDTAQSTMASEQGALDNRISDEKPFFCYHERDINELFVRRCAKQCDFCKGVKSE